MPANCRILLIDDVASIHDDFRKVFRLSPTHPDLDRTEALLLGLQAPEAREACEAFELDCAYQGRDGLAMAEAALQDGRPYALAFVDMRMPPGWDGVETIEHLWRVDPQMQVVICTAYSDHPWQGVLARLDVRDRLLIVKKPFDIIEVSQLARTLTAKWSMAREAKRQTASLEAALLDLKAVEGALRVSNRQLEAYSYSVSHDLRSPLGIISGFGSMLAKRIRADDPKAAHFLARIMTAAAQMEQLIEGMLALAQVARVRLMHETVDLGRMATEILNSLQAADPSRMTSIRVQDGLIAAGDPRLIRVAMENLLSNAWKYTSRQAHAEITVGQMESADARPLFYVRDNGAGFDMAFAQKLFGAFQRLHSAAEFPGTGVGLATVHRVMERHGGRIWAESQPGKGATFFFTFGDARHEPPATEHKTALENDSRFGNLD